MELKNELTMVISSCDAFSDLWEIHMDFLKKNWISPGMKTFLITDEQTNKMFDQVHIISAGRDKEWSERLAHAVSQVETEYVFLTLDDYFLIEPVDMEEIETILQLMEQQKLDYVRLSGYVHHPTRARMAGYKKVYWLDTSRCYSVNLTAGFWRKSFLEATLSEAKNIWQYEVSLAKKAEELHARGVTYKDHNIKILDVVRKGKLLNRAARYFKKYGLYDGTRKIISPWYEVKIFIRTWANRLLPLCVTRWIRKILNKFGYHYLSQEA